MVSTLVANHLFFPYFLDCYCNYYFQFLLLGIGKPPGQMDPKAFLLQKFNVTARQRVSSWFTVKNTFGSFNVMEVSTFNLVPVVHIAPPQVFILVQFEFNY